MTDKENSPEKSPPADAGKTTIIAEELLDILVCPLTKTRLHYDRKANELISKAAKLAYPVHNGIPVMLPSEARELTEDDKPTR